MPGFWLGLMLILVFAVELKGLLPAYGSGSLRHLILPAVALAAAPSPRTCASSAPGCSRCSSRTTSAPPAPRGRRSASCLYRHALKNAALPFVTVAGLSLGFMLSGAIIIETVFSWPGLGRLLVQAASARDFPVIQAGVFLFGVIFVLVNLAVDLLYAVVDPQVRLS